jgi:hypothetical protein
MAAERDGDPDLRPRDQLIAELRSLCAAKRTGTLFIITIENHPAQVVLRDGEIVGLSYRLNRGPDALAPLKAFAAARYRFQQESVSSTDPRLPPTAEVLAVLGAESRSAPDRPPAPSTTASRTAAVAPPPADTRPAIGSSPDISEAVDRLRLLIERELAEFLGPMAGLICGEHLADPSAGSQEVAKLLEAIAKEIGDPAKEAQFKQRVLSQLARG